MQSAALLRPTTASAYYRAQRLNPKQPNVCWAYVTDLGAGVAVPAAIGVAIAAVCVARAHPTSPMLAPHQLTTVAAAGSTIGGGVGGDGGGCGAQWHVRAPPGSHSGYPGEIDARSASCAPQKCDHTESRSPSPSASATV